MPFEINNLEIGFTTNFYLKIIIIIIIIIIK